jgi:TIR domain
MPSVFVCHRKADVALVEPIALELRLAGHQVWLDEWEIDVGDSIVARVDAGLGGASYLILCCSATGQSLWTDREWMSTLARQLAGHSIRLLPVLIDGKGRKPSILADIRFADLAADWTTGMKQLMAAIK